MGYLHTAFVIACSTAIAGFLRAWWDRYKARKALEPTPMKLKKGSYVPWSSVKRIERVGRVILIFWLVWMAAWFSALLYAAIFNPSLIGR